MDIIIDIKRGIVTVTEMDDVALAADIAKGGINAILQYAAPLTLEDPDEDDEPKPIEEPQTETTDKNPNQEIPSPTITGEGKREFGGINGLPKDYVMEPPAALEETFSHTIPPEPTQREPLGKAIARLQEEKKIRNAQAAAEGKAKNKGKRGGSKNTKPVVLTKDGETKWFETRVEAAIFLNCAPSGISDAIRTGLPKKGWYISNDNAVIMP